MRRNLLQSTQYLNFLRPRLLTWTVQAEHAHVPPVHDTRLGIIAIIDFESDFGNPCQTGPGFCWRSSARYDSVIDTCLDDVSTLDGYCCCIPRVRFGQNNISFFDAYKCFRRLTVHAINHVLHVIMHSTP
jgi:hypothetical protein